MFSDIEKENDDKTNEKDQGKQSSPFDKKAAKWNIRSIWIQTGICFPDVNISKVDSQKKKEDEDKQTKSFIHKIKKFNMKPREICDY